MAKFKLREGFGKHYTRDRKLVEPGQVCEMERLPKAFLDKFEPVDVGARQMVKKLKGEADDHETGAAEAAPKEEEKARELRGVGRPRKE